MCSEQMLRQLESMAADPRFRAMSRLDLQNILTAIELCGLGFSRGLEVAQDLNLLLTDEWPVEPPTQNATHKYQIL
jgi:hypothetical protein